MPANYYNDAHVRSRLIEFLGGSSLEEATAMFVTSDGQSKEDRYNPRPTKDIWILARPEAEIARSLWDRESLIEHIDVENVNFDDAGEPFAHRSRSFDLQRPVVRAVEELLLDCEIAPLHILSGRGHHFAWRPRTVPPRIGRTRLIVAARLGPRPYRSHCDSMRRARNRCASQCKERLAVRTPCPSK